MRSKAILAILTLIIYIGSYCTVGARTATPQDTDTICADSIMPDDLLPQLDSMLGVWYASHYLSLTDGRETLPVNPSFSDSVYLRRMQSLPTIIDMPYNREVRSVIDQYTARRRNSTAIILGLFPIYEDIFVEALARYGLPLELKYLPIIESALRPKAYSRAGAAGMWQFIYSTGRKYGLNVNSLVDDRYDVRLASDAAARYLKELYDIFQDWDLAISAYNCGSGNVTKAIKRSGSTDFWKMYPYLPRETRGYLPAFIAINYVMNFHGEHGIYPAAASISPATDTLHINRNLHLKQISELCGVPMDELKAYNPQYTGDIIPGAYRTCILTLPTGYILPLIEAGDSLYTHRQDEFFPKSRTAYIDDEMMNRRTYIEHKIKDGETLSSIAVRYHTTVKNIKSWNNMTSDRIRAGKTLRIYNR